MDVEVIFLMELKGDEGCHNVKELKEEQSEFVEIKTDLINPVIADADANSINEFVLHEESIKKILDAGCLKNQERKVPAEKSTEIETILVAQRDLRGTRKQQDLGQNEYEKCSNETKSPTVGESKRRTNSSRSKEPQPKEDAQNEGDLGRFEAKQTFGSR